MKTIPPIESIKPVRVLIHAVTNKDKMKVIDEYRKISADLERIELEFYGQLFDESNCYSYKELYSVFLELYQKTCVQIERSKKLRYICLNRMYFHDLFFPYERSN